MYFYGFFAEIQQDSDDQNLPTGTWIRPPSPYLLFGVEIRFFFFCFTSVSFVRHLFFLHASFCRNDENQFRVCAPSGNRTNTPPVPCQPIYHCIPIYYKISFILFDDEHTTKPIDSLLLFIYIYFAPSPVYILI